MKEFSIIYKILKILRDSMDCEEFDQESISSDVLEISETKRRYLIEMLADAGYITGVTVLHTAGDIAKIRMNRPRITIKGLEYLEENSMMKKAMQLAKGIKEVIPGT